MYKLNKQELVAAKKVLGLVNLDATDENIEHYQKCDYLTINTGNDGEDYCWYLDADDNEACVCVNTLKEVNPEDVGLI